MVKVVFIWALLIITLFACKGSEEGQKPEGLVEGKGEEARESGPPLSQSLTGVPEIVSVKFTPSSPKVDDVIKAEVLARDDASASYRWELNGRPLEISENSLSLREFKRGDKISLTVTPFIGNREGNSVTVFTYIFNSPPKIVSRIGDSKYEDRRFVYQVKAADPDDDPLTYSLKLWPEGMKIDSSSGFITWEVPPRFTGKVFVTVSVADGHGGETTQDLSLEIQPEQEKS